MAARASLWMLQWIDLVCGATACTRLTSPLCRPNMAAAPSVLMPTHFDQSIPCSVMKLFNMSKSASAVVRVGKHLQKRKSSSISPLCSYLTYESRLARLAMSVDSSNCSAKNRLAFIRAISWSFTLLAISSILRCTVLSDNGIKSICLHAFSPSITPTATLIDGSTTSSPSVCAFPFFAIILDNLYETSTALALLLPVDVDSMMFLLL